ncbi:MAG: hypothetical protein J6T96_11600 [Bacteroidales bacterium]|nr:hypothetical protein [Bacteroidales bacterium]
MEKTKKTVAAILLIAGVVCLCFEVYMMGCFLIIAALLFRYGKKRDGKDDDDDEHIQNIWRMNNNNFNNI